jgi:hypothetical protein
MTGAMTETMTEHRLAMKVGSESFRIHVDDLTPEAIADSIARHLDTIARRVTIGSAAGYKNVRIQVRDYNLQSTIGGKHYHAVIVQATGLPLAHRPDTETQHQHTWYVIRP